MAFSGFDKDFLGFLRALAKNNDKKWFDANKQRYRDSVQDPFLEFLEALAPKMAKISAHIPVVAKRSGGSMNRIFRDTRFSKDKTPYNTHVIGIFRHEVGKDASAPGYYVRIDAKKVTLGTGIWRPETPSSKAIRDAIVADPKTWKKIRDDKKFVEYFGELTGDSLKRPPKGYDPEHDCVEDLKRKDLVGFRELKPQVIHDKGFLAEVERTYKAGKKLNQFVCGALGLPF